MKLIALVLCLATAAAAADQPLYPLAVGARWTYAAHVTYLSGGAKKEKDLTWTMEVVKQDGDTWQLRGHPCELAFYEEGRVPGVRTVARVGAVQHRLEGAVPPSALTTALNAETVEFQPPYTKGAMYGDPEQIKATPGRYCWVVEDAPKDLPTVRGAPPPTGPAFNVVMRTSPDHTEITVVPGVGIVRYVYVHHGTPGDATLTLTEYRPGP